MYRCKDFTESAVKGLILYQLAYISFSSLTEVPRRQSHRRSGGPSDPALCGSCPL